MNVRIYGCIVMCTVTAWEFLSHVKKIFLFWTFLKKSSPKVEHSLEGSLLPTLAPLTVTTVFQHWQQQPRGIYSSLTRNNLITLTVVTRRSVSRAPQDKLHTGCTWELLDSSALPKMLWYRARSLPRQQHSTAWEPSIEAQVLAPVPAHSSSQVRTERFLNCSKRSSRLLDLFHVWNSSWHAS